VGAKTLVLFHHDPDSTDRMVDGLLRQARKNFDSVFGGLAKACDYARVCGKPDGSAYAGDADRRLRREAQFRAKVRCYRK